MQSRPIAPTKYKSRPRGMRPEAEKCNSSKTTCQGEKKACFNLTSEVETIKVK